MHQRTTLFQLEIAYVTEEESSEYAVWRVPTNHIYH